MSTRFWQETPTDHPVTDLPDRADVVVVGAGITGLTTALLLAEAGRSVAVVESRKVGAGASGATTGKVSQLQGTRLSTLVDSGDRELAEDYLAANTFGMDWLRQFCLDHRVPVEHASAFTFSTGEDVEQVGEEHRVARSLGLATRLHGKLDQPFPVAAAVELPGQFQLNPAELLQALSRAVVKAGGTITEDSRVTPRETPSRVEVSTRGGDITAGQVILATATPILDRRSATFQLMAQRSYLCAFDVEAQQLPTGMFISVETPPPDFPAHRRFHPAGRRFRAPDGYEGQYPETAAGHRGVDGHTLSRRPAHPQLVRPGLPPRRAGTDGGVTAVGRRPGPLRRRLLQVGPGRGPRGGPPPGRPRDGPTSSSRLRLGLPARHGEEHGEDAR